MKRFTLDAHFTKFHESGRLMWLKPAAKVRTRHISPLNFKVQTKTIRQMWGNIWQSPYNSRYNWSRADWKSHCVVFGRRTNIVARVADIEKQLGIYDVSQFTPRWSLDIRAPSAEVLTWATVHCRGP